MEGFPRSPSLAIGTDSPGPRRSRSRCLATGRAAFTSPVSPPHRGSGEILFVVRPRVPSAPILLTIETNTYAAYNCVGGKCLFPYLSTDRSHSNLVTFERPLQPDIMGGFYAWDQFFTSWLDAEGYQVDYCVNADHDQQPNLLDDYPAHLRICHGEYSSRQDLSGVGLPAMPPPRACLCHCRVRRLTFLLDPSPSPGVRLGVSSTALRPPIDPDTGRQATKPY